MDDTTGARASLGRRYPTAAGIATNQKMASMSIARAAKGSSQWNAMGVVLLGSMTQRDVGRASACCGGFGHSVVRD